MASLFYNILTNRTFIWLLFLINLAGSVYGYIWYGFQLEQTEPIYLIFVPDSPTASLFFTIFLLLMFFGKNAPYVGSLAMVTLFKYGIWAVVMNILTLMVEGSLHWTGYMLIISHGAMALQGLLYAPFYQMKLRHVAVAGVWTLHNDVIDYVFEQMPIYGPLMDYLNPIGYFTFWLSIVSIALAYVLAVRPRLKKSYDY